VEFSILGTLEVRRDGRPLVIGGEKRRALLAMLVLNANEAVSPERLALALWGEEVPPNAVRTVQVHVSRLRAALGEYDSIRRTPGGYRLQVPADELDAERFERLVEEGRAALSGGDPEQAGALLRDALRLWRGPALADLAGEAFAQAEIARLEENRLGAVEMRIEADLAAGRHAEVVGELRRLAGEHPLRERLHGQLMLALYRCGRQADALAAYRRAREAFVDELGIEPGPELRELERGILTHDTTLRGPSSRAATTVGTSHAHGGPPRRAGGPGCRVADKAPGDAHRLRGRRQDAPGD
jgi:DNA-binding SARP family transcriptional activator